MDEIQGIERDLKYGAELSERAWNLMHTFREEIDCLADEAMIILPSERSVTDKVMMFMSSQLCQRECTKAFKQLKGQIAQLN